MIVALYADGGCVSRNPSPLGLTWAWCAVDENDRRVIERSGFVPSPGDRLLTNNHAEQIAIVLALEAMPAGWSGLIYSDSMVALGRVFRGWRCTNLPECIIRRTQAAKHRLGTLRHELLKGHPTKRELAAGIGRNGRRVSSHNVWVDHACSLQAHQAMNQSSAKEMHGERLCTNNWPMAT
ncbi:MAG: RNase [Blastocatellia bacterium]